MGWTLATCEKLIDATPGISLARILPKLKAPIQNRSRTSYCQNSTCIQQKGQQMWILFGPCRDPGPTAYHPATERSTLLFGFRHVALQSETPLSFFEPFKVKETDTVGLAYSTCLHGSLDLDNYINTIVNQSPGRDAYFRSLQGKKTGPYEPFWGPIGNLPDERAMFKTLFLQPLNHDSIHPFVGSGIKSFSLARQVRKILA